MRKKTGFAMAIYGPLKDGVVIGLFADLLEAKEGFFSLTIEH